MTQETADYWGEDGPCRLTLDIFLSGGPVEIQLPEETIGIFEETGNSEPEELFTFENPEARINEALNRVYEGPCDQDPDEPIGLPLPDEPQR
jgi:hypothetical protein